MPKVRLIARITPKPNRREDVVTVMKKLVQPSRAEEGINFYEMYLSNEGGRIFFNEEYDSQQVMDRHMATSLFVEVFAALKDLLAEPPEVNILTEIDPVR